MVFWPSAGPLPFGTGSAARSKRIPPLPEPSAAALSPFPGPCPPLPLTAGMAEPHPNHRGTPSEPKILHMKSSPGNLPGLLCPIPGQENGCAPARQVRKKHYIFLPPCQKQEGWRHIYDRMCFGDIFHAKKKNFSLHCVTNRGARSLQ